MYIVFVKCRLPLSLRVCLSFKLFHYWLSCILLFMELKLERWRPHVWQVIIILCCRLSHPSYTSLPTPENNLILIHIWLWLRCKVWQFQAWLFRIWGIFWPFLSILHNSTKCHNSVRYLFRYWFLLDWWRKRPYKSRVVPLKDTSSPFTIVNSLFLVFYHVFSSSINCFYYCILLLLKTTQWKSRVFGFFFDDLTRRK